MQTTPEEQVQASSLGGLRLACRGQFFSYYFLFVLISSALQDEKRRLDDQIAQMKEELEEEQLNSEMSNERYKRSAQQVRTYRSLVT